MAERRPIATKVATLARAGPRQALLVAEAAASMLVARVSLAIHPFSKVAHGFGTFVSPSDPRVLAHAPGHAVEPERAALVREIGWAVRSIAPFVPFKSVCLQQAMAAHAMLRRRGIASAMHYGAGRGETRPLEAHAWLDAGGVRVTGYPIAPHIHEIGCFV
jgi:hypothetical protein